MSDEIPKVRDQPPPSPDAKARAEAADISSGRYRRDERRQTHVHVGGLVLFWFCIICAIVATSVWLINLLAPDKWHFLTAPEGSQLQNLLIAFAGSTIVTEYARGFIGRK